MVFLLKEKLLKIESKFNVDNIVIDGKIQSLKQIRITNAGEKNNLIGFVYLLAPAIALFLLFYPSVGFQPAQILSNGDPMNPMGSSNISA